jgi:hypothetical protein
MTTTDQQDRERDAIPPHLTKDPGEISRQTEHDLDDHEFYCLSCELKITRTAASGREYGHRPYPHCEHKIRLRGHE